MSEILHKLNVNRIIMISMSLTIALGLKYHYSHSRAEDLDWMLAPASYLVQKISGMEFDKVDGTGYADKKTGITIAPSCSGINFMIIVFCLSAYMALKSVPNISSVFMRILFSIIVSYVYTLMVNTFRILLSIHSFKTGLFRIWFSWKTIHLLEGVVIYFAFLLIYYSLLKRLMGGESGKHPSGVFRQIREYFPPMIFYYSVILAVPVINHGGLPPVSGFANYASMVLVACPAVIALYLMFRACCYYLIYKLK